MSAYEELEREIRALKLKSTLQELALIALIDRLIERKPELGLKEAFANLHAETVHHYSKHVRPEIAEAIEAYFASLVIKTPPPSR